MRHERPRSQRSMEANKLRADLGAGRLMEQAVWQAEQAYRFSPSTYTFECLSAMHRLRRQLQQILCSMTGETSTAALQSSPQQGHPS